MITHDTPPELAVGLPSGLSATAVAARKAAMIAAGTPPLHAEKFAIDAEQAQAAREAHLKGKGHRVLTPAEQEAKAILDAQKLDPSKPAKPVSAHDLAQREATVADAEAAVNRLVATAKTDREAAEDALAEARKLNEAAAAKGKK